MLNVEQYISGGIIESYVLGIASEQEKRELEALLLLYPDLQNAVEDFEKEIERNALQNAVPPPEGTYKEVLRRIEIEKERTYRRNGNGHHGSFGTFIPVLSESSDLIRVHKYWRVAFIVIFILSKIFLFFMLYYYFMYKDAIKDRVYTLPSLEHIRSVPKQ